MRNQRIGLLLFLLSLASCKKSNFLDASPDKAVVVPSSLEDFQQIMDNEIIMNGTAATTGVIPSLGELAADNYYIINGGFSSTLFVVGDKNIYLWNDEIGANASDDWITPYKAIFYSNLAIEGCAKFSNSITRDNIVGYALFHRAHMFYQLAQNFAPPFEEKSANLELGIPLRLSADVNEKLKRSTIKDTYDQIIKDLSMAIELLPLEAKYKTRPSKLAAFGLLARTYLSMGLYDSAFKYSNEYLMRKDNLLDYNSVGTLPLYQDNPEVIFQCQLMGHILLSSSRNRVDSLLYLSYQNDDLRKNLFFRAASNPNGGRFKTSYDGSSSFFGGVATDEILLIRSECYARSENISLAMNDLNKLMKSRWNNAVPYPEIEASSREEAVDKILVERRKEIVFRGLRWTDLRRLNLEGRSIQIERKLDNVSYILAPNSLHYTFLIPPSVTMFNTEWPQNPR